VDLSDVADGIRTRFDSKMTAREAALAASRSSIRASANAIRAIHRGDLGEAHRLMEESRAALEAGRSASRSAHPDIYFAGFLQDAQKEYAEARLTEAVVTGSEAPTPEELSVEPAPYLNGMSEAIGEGRRAILDLLRRGDVEAGERILAAMDDIYALLVTVDYPDAITGNLRRSTDVARGILEKTRGDLTMALVQNDLRTALEGHARGLGDG
jgi:translin